MLRLYPAINKPEYKVPRPAAVREAAAAALSGAQRGPESFFGFPFAYDTSCDDLISFTPDFRRAVFKKAFLSWDISLAELDAVLTESDGESGFSYFDIDEKDPRSVCRVLHVRMSNGKPVFGEFNMFKDNDGALLAQLVEALGFRLEFERARSGRAAEGIYYVR